MNSYVATPRTVLLSAVYLIAAIIILLIMGIAQLYFFEYAVFPALNWFNAQHWAIKITIVVLGGYALFWGLLQITARLSAMLGGLIFEYLPHNTFTQLSAMVLMFANAIGWTIWLWRFPEHYGFWVVVELVLLTAFVWMLSAVVLPQKIQAQLYDNDPRNR